MAASQNGMMDVDDMGEGDFMQEAIHLESKFYQSGYQEGFDHGKLHGIFEGRQLGQEKAWELWEEVGFYEGFANVWAAKLQGATGRKEVKSLHHAQTLLELIHTFPTTNPTPIPDAPLPSTIESPWNNDAVEEEMGAIEAREGDSTGAPTGDGATRSAGSAGVTAGGAAEGAEEPDLANTLSNIRARYRLLCTSVGSRPRLFASSKDGSDVGGAVVEGIEGPMKGVDTRQLRF